MSVIKVRNELGQFVDIPALQGEKGDKGDTGATGATGANGQDGQDGVSITSATAGGSYQSGKNTVTPITFNKSDGSNVTVNVQAKNGVDGQDGANGTSVTVVQATDENNAISLSTQHPNNIYYWEE